VATKIKLARFGKMRSPHYRIVIADARKKRDGRSIETIGRYHPKEDPSFIEVDSERAQYWLGVGAQPTEAVTALFRVTGDWQKFKGEPAPEPMRTAEPKADKHAAFASAAAESAGVEDAPATTPKKKAAPKKAAAKDEAGDAKGEDAKGEDAKGEDAKGEAPATDTAAAAQDEAVSSDSPAADQAAEATEATAAAEAATATEA
jgi:small subunit ribosomal protein S16